MSDTNLSLPTTAPSGEHLASPAPGRGFRRKYPACGRSALFDGPACLIILIVGHIMASAILIGFVELRANPLAFTAGVGGLSLFLLPWLKGGPIGLQRAKRTHRFGGNEKAGTGA